MQSKRQQQLLLLLTLTISSIFATVTGADDAHYRYAIIKIPELGDGRWAGARAINDLGHVVGFSDNGPEVHPFFWDGTRSVDLGTFGGIYGEAWDINNNDQIVGVAKDADQIDRSFFWRDGEVEMLGEGQLRWGRAYCINDNSQVGGEGGIPGEDVGRPLLWQDGEFIVLPEFDPVHGAGEVRSINERGVMAGTSWAGTNRQATVWLDGEYEILGSLGDGTARSHVWGINNHDVLAGQSQGVGPNHPWYAALWIDGKIHNLSKQDRDFVARVSTAKSINDRGAIVGHAWSRKHDEGQPYLYTPERGFEAFKDLIPPHHKWDFDYFLATVSDINNHDQIAGIGTFKADPNQFIHAYLLTPVSPELSLRIADGPLVADAVNSLTITGAQPNAKIKFFYGKQGGGKFIPGCDALAAMTQINDPVLFGEAVADGDGNAELEIYIPARAATHKGFLIQAVDFGNCAESQLVLKKVE